MDKRKVEEWRNHVVEIGIIVLTLGLLLIFLILVGSLAYLILTNL